jgi:hypothetical protein
MQGWGSFGTVILPPPVALLKQRPPLWGQTQGEGYHGLDLRLVGQGKGVGLKPVPLTLIVLSLTGAFPRWPERTWADLRTR